MRRLSLMVALLSAAGACRSGPPRAASPAPRAPAPAPGGKLDRDLVVQLTVLAIGAQPSDAELAAAQRHATVAEYVDELVRDPRMGRDVVARFTFRELLVTPGFLTTISFYTLKRADDGGAAVYYLRKPCPAAQAVKVAPWWDLDHEILVCPDSYQPDHWVRTDASKRYNKGVGAQLLQHCNSVAGSPLAEVSPYCGCGPNLLRCYRDDKHMKEIVQSMQDELVQTVGYITDQDLPVAELFTSESTFHDKNVEFTYRQWRIEDQQKSDVEALRSLRDWPAEGKWAPRPEWAPGQHAGVITAPRLLHEHGDRRQRMRDIYDKLWCSKPTSVGATVQQVLSLKAKSLQIQQEGWEELASRPLCTDCHARLDYSWQFMRGWGDSRVVANHFVTKLQDNDKVGAFYGKNIHDKRGEGKLDTRTMAEMAVAQPEFSKCMVGNVARHVFGPHVGNDDMAALQAAYADRPTFKNLMRQALLRYAATWAKAPDALPKLTGGPAGAKPDPIEITPPLRAALDEYCTDCHAQGGTAHDWDFEAKALPRALVVRALDQVAWGRMPRERPLDSDSHYALTLLLIETLWADEASRNVAARHFLGRAAALPVHAPAFTENIVDGLAGAGEKVPDADWSLIEAGLSSDELTLTPGYGAFIGIDALERCKAAGHGGAELEACLLRATDPAAHAKTRIPSAAP